jgi:nucleoside-diphosphate-sugar epimerase
MISMQLINIIGGSGFIGTRLTKRLIQGCGDRVRIIDKVISKSFPEITSIGDVRDVDQLQNVILDQSIIINLAAEHRDDVRPLSLYDDVNIGGAKNICTVAREKNVRTIIFTSTVAIYGFAELGTDETGIVAPFNDYGRTKYSAEQVFKAWQAERPDERTLVIIRPTVIFGEQNRGNVYSLLRQISSGKFIMVGKGENRKSMAYVENVAAFIEYSMTFSSGVHIYNYIDKPDFSMNELVINVNGILGRSTKIQYRLPYPVGYLIGKIFDIVARLTRRHFSVSSIRIKKFCSNSVYDSAVDGTGFIRPIPLEKALEKTMRYEFIESHEHEGVFFTE